MKRHAEVIVYFEIPEFRKTSVVFRHFQSPIQDVYVRKYKSNYHWNKVDYRQLYFVSSRVFEIIDGVPYITKNTFNKMHTRNKKRRDKHGQYLEIALQVGHDEGSIF